MKDMMELDDEFEDNKGQNEPEVFMSNQYKVRSALGHPEFLSYLVVTK